MKEITVLIGLWTLIVLGAAFAGAIAYSTFSLQATDAQDSSLSGGVTKTNTLTAGTTGNGDVEVSLTPQGVNGGQFAFTLALNTHSVDLSSLDLRQAATLEYNGKKVYAASGPQLGGHHINGKLTFPVDRIPGEFTVRIAGIPKQQERVYSW